MLKEDVVYNTMALLGGGYQSTVTVPALELAQEFTGELSEGWKEAEQSAGMEVLKFLNVLDVDAFGNVRKIDLTADAKPGLAKAISCVDGII